MNPVDGMRLADSQRNAVDRELLSSDIRDATQGSQFRVYYFILHLRLQIERCPLTERIQNQHISLKIVGI